MKYQILQIKDWENSAYLFAGWSWAKKFFNLKDYQVMYEGEIEGNTTKEILDTLFAKFNINPPKDFRGSSLSVSDVIKLGRKYYFVDSVDFVEVK
jgi:hypothetical protein